MCRNAEDKDKVWTFGSGPRHCIGHLLSSGILKVRTYKYSSYSTLCTTCYYSLHIILNLASRLPPPLSLIHTYTQECLLELSRRFTWQLAPGQNLAYKVLPVSRPKDDISVVFIDKQS